jgi:hypothetical protein
MKLSLCCVCARVLPPQYLRAVFCNVKQYLSAVLEVTWCALQLVQNCRAVLMELLESGLVDIVFANEEEALALMESLDGGSHSHPSTSGDQLPTS